MNIFVLDENPYIAAQYLCDKHVVKMILESAQLLCTVAHERGYNAPYRATHKHHPCTKWVAESSANWDWLLAHAYGICDEYTKRYKKVHKSESVITELDSKSSNIWESSSLDFNFKNHTPFVQCVPDEYKRDNAVDAYRAYYIGDKKDFAKWTAPSKQPDWFSYV